MYLLGLIFCALTVTNIVIVSGKTIPKDDDDVPDLKWPKKYTFQAEKLSLTAGWVEDVAFWRTSKKSRVDYNKGAVKSFSVKPRRKSSFRYGVEYEVHPESTEEEKNKFVCTRTNGTTTHIISLEDVLPDEDIFVLLGTDIVEEQELQKFSYINSDDDEDVRQTLWAVYNREEKYWMPVRFESIQYNTWLGLKIKHEAWSFYNYDTDFDEDVFDVEEMYDCQDGVGESDETQKTSNYHLQNIDPENDVHIELVFNAFKQKHSKVYADEKEHALRRNLFQQRMRLVLENNRKNTGYKLAINKFADRTPKEMKRYTGLIHQSKRESDTHPFPYTKSEIKNKSSELPKNFDLRDLGVITPVRDQEKCGSCWTFGTTSAVEGALARRNGGRLLRLSNQALIDCAWGFGVSGCNGGNDIAAYRWMMAHGLPTEEEYGPYANRNGFCRIDNMTEIYPIRGFTNVTPFSTEALKVALVNHGPLSVSIHVTDTLSLYQGGIFYDIECNPTELNHEVTLVGYGERDGEEYWIVKNSWGQTWGVDGYLHISVRDNNCGIATEPTYVVL